VRSTETIRSPHRCRSSICRSQGALSRQRAIGPVQRDQPGPHLEDADARAPRRHVHPLALSFELPLTHSCEQEGDDGVETEPRPAERLSGARDYEQWAWDDSNVRPHAYQSDRRTLESDNLQPLGGGSRHLPGSPLALPGILPDFTDTLTDTPTHIPGSISVSSRTEAAKCLDRDDEIVVYCTNVDCPASKRLYGYLEGTGYKRLRRYADGINGWLEAGYQLEGDQARPRVG